MWLIFAYRKISFSPYKKYLASLFNHILFLKQHFDIVFPQEVSKKKWLQVSLCFDYASADFYQTILPFLIKHNIKAILGISCRYIVDKITCDLNKRLFVPDGLATLDNIFIQQQPFCSWEELLDIKKSQLIDFASHGFSIRNLKNNPNYLSKEINLSKITLETKLQQPIKHFIYPLGITDDLASKLVHKTYEYSFLLGNAINKNNCKHSLYRINITNTETLNNSLFLKNFITFIKNACFHRAKKLFTQKRLTHPLNDI